MAGDSGLNALSLLPENELPQWQQKIRLNHIIKYLGPEEFLRICAIFCRYWTCTFSCRNNQAIGAEVVCIFTFFYIPFLFAKWQWELHRKILL